VFLIDKCFQPNGGHKGLSLPGGALG